MSTNQQKLTVKTVLLCCPERYQAYFANRLNEQTNLAGIVLVGADNIHHQSGIRRLLANKLF